MNRPAIIAALLCAALLPAGAEGDPGLEKVAELSVTVYHATNGDPTAAGERAKSVPAATAERLAREERLRFKHYSRLGRDAQPLLRSYESWAQPLKPSDEVLVRFEARGHPEKSSAVVDVELWLARKKILKTDARLEADRPLYMLGPEWRGGRLIIAVALAKPRNPASVNPRE
jgi:hypothetical protein